MVRAQILKMRDNPEIASTMAGAFSRRNAAEIQGVLGRQPSSGELYIAHFLGANGAKRFLSLRAANPNAFRGFRVSGSGAREQIDLLRPEWCP